MLVGIKAYARHRKENGWPGGSPAAVRKAIERGQISKNSDGLIDLEAADRNWPGEKPRDEGTPGGTAAGSPPSANGGEPSVTPFNVARGRKELALARRRELEVDQLAGELLRKSTVKAAAFEILRAARDELMAIPDRLAEVVAGEDDPNACHKLILDELDRVLHRAADRLQGLAEAKRA